MNVIKVTQPVIDAVKALLADLTIGFNATIAEVGGDLVVFDFTSTSKNFYTSWMNPDQLAVSSIMRYPLMMLFGVASQSTCPKRMTSQKDATSCTRVLLGAVDVIEHDRHGTVETVDNFVFHAATIISAATIFSIREKLWARMASLATAAASETVSNTP
jgi:hypothetical protein